MKSAGSRAFQAVGDDKLVEIISNAQRRLLFIAPGVSKRVSDAIAELWRRLPGGVSVILDVDPNICRLGYLRSRNNEKTLPAQAEMA